MRSPKASSSEFTFEGLPHSRKAQFWDILKTRFSIVFQFGGIDLLFGLPFLLAYAFNNIGLIPYAEGNYSGEQLEAFLATNTFIFSIVYSICLVILSIGLAGLSRLMKKLAWGQGIYFWHDFGKGIKENAGSFVLTTIIFDFCYVASVLLGGLSSNLIISNLPTAFLLLITPFFMITLVSCSFYSSPYGKIWGNSFSLLARRPMTSLLFLFGPFAIVLIELIPLPMVSLIVYVLLLFLLLPIFVIALYLFCLDGFDRYTNVSLFPAFYHRGLADEYDDERKEAAMKNDINNRRQY